MRINRGRGRIPLLAAGVVLAAALGLAAVLPTRGETAAYQKTDHTDTLGDISSSYGILVNADTGEILAAKDETARIVPASMTKVMTVLVAAEQLQNQNLSDTVEITEDILETVSTDNDAAMGFQAGEIVTVADCLYGTALHSGADAAIALGRYVSGSDSAFVDAMNKKAEELGLSDTHFVNAVGAYDEEQYSTVEDIAKIMQAALSNDLARKILSTRQYTTVKTSVHPDGITVSNRFLKRMETQDVPGIVFSAKTGFLSAAGFCAVSSMTGTDGTRYICCTAKAPDTWSCIYDHAAIYRDCVGTEDAAEADTN
ncbi:MAG: D-alanyl-D-alanine carboxypeptidase family protein [Lachnospiraceae bacterium]